MCACKQTETYFLNVNGFETEVRYTEREIKGVLDVVLDTLVSIHEARDDGFRTVAFLSGPPGAGKSTLCLSMEKRASRRNIRFPVQCLGLDGFHKRAKELRETHIVHHGKDICLSEIKGAPETFDARMFVECLSAARLGKEAVWPVYDRRIHDVSDETVPITGEILIVEGNWLMLSGEWAKGRELCDYTIALTAPEALLKQRLIERKMRGGRTEAEAAAWYERTDGENIKRYALESAKSRLVLCDDQEEIRIY